MPVCHGTHDASHGEAVKIIVNKYQYSQHNSGQLGSRTAFDFFLRPPPEGRRAAGAVHQAHHGSQYDKEYQDSHVITVGQHRDKAILKNVGDSAFKLKAGIKQSSHQDPYKQGTVHFLRNKRQHNCHNRRYQ